MLDKASLRFKITFSVVAYVIIIGVTGNLFVYFHLQQAVFRKTEQLDRDREEAVRLQLERDFENLMSLAAVCASDPELLHLVSRQGRTQQEIVLDSLNVQEHINAFIRGNPVNPYISKLILFSESGLFVQAQGRNVGYPGDLDSIRTLPLYTRIVADNLPWVSGFGPPINSSTPRDAYIMLFRIQSAYRNNAETYLYIETGIDMITDALRNYGADSEIFAQIPETGEVILRDHSRLVRTGEDERGYVPANAEFPYYYKNKADRKYRLDRLSLKDNTLVLYNPVDVTSLAVDDRRILYTVVGTVLVSLFAAAGLALGLSIFLTRPIHVIIQRINKISEENDLSHDPEIEKRGDEIGRIGRAVNEMSGSISRFLVKMEEQYRKQKDAELALLQTQINPHFIYNTLDSIQWMAKIQNNTAIADIIRHLGNLLRNLAAGSSPGNSRTKITLAEELAIVHDYVEIMSIRFVGNFEVTNHIPESLLGCRILRFTLQPLVENAIIHGIEPAGRFGVINISAAFDDRYVDITVADNGVGMSQEQLETLTTCNRPDTANRPSLNRIGVANVAERLKLVYGESCGLSFESRKDEYTIAKVRIMKEQ